MNHPDGNMRMQNSDKTSTPPGFIFILLAVLAASLPFENVLMMTAQIDTPFRPHRILAIIIGAFIFLIQPVEKLRYTSNDLKLPGLYVFGLIPTFFAFLDERLEFNYFLLTTLQLFIILWIYLQAKTLQLEEFKINLLFHIYCFFSMLNAMYMIHVFLFDDVGRQSGFMDNPNYSAFTLNVAFAYYLYRLTGKSHPISSFKSLYFFLAMVVVLAGIFVTGSRSALISLVVTLLLFGIIQFNWKKFGIALLLVGGVLFWFSQSEIGKKYLEVVPLLNRWESLAGREEARITLWKQGWQAFEDTYFMGLGIEQFKNPQIYIQYLQSSDNPMLVSQEGLVLHNDYLAVLFEFGVIPFLLFMSFYIVLLSKLRKKWNRSYGALWFVVMVNVVIFSFFDTTFQSLPFWFVVMLLSSFADSEGGQIQKPPESYSTSTL